MNKWLLGILAGGLIFLLAWLFLPALPFVPRMPVAKIYAEPPEGVAPLTVLLVSVGANSKNEELQFEWTVDGAVVSNSVYFHHRLETVGQHTITLKVTDRRGASSTDAVTVNVPQGKIAWSTEGPLGGMHCVQVSEPADPAPWDNDYLCSYLDVGFKWSSAGPITGMRCTQITEPAEPAEHGWTDNYLCVPESSPLELTWSNAGPVAGKKCLRIGASRDRHGWKNNALCYSVSSIDVAQKPAE
ncbi:MAG TPA: PKD domain-containing protein [Candidatus Binatia bacterium]|nr:PKD domain-containing protein [Candidatus Binatia bacterium]